MRAPTARRGCLLLALLGLTAGAALAQNGADGAVAAQRAEFRAAYDLARSGIPASGADSENLAAYVLYPYLQAARLAQAVGRADEPWTEADEEIRGFIAYHEREPVAWGARRAWLESLARREQWEPFLDNFSEDVADTRLRCQYLAGRIALERLSGIAPLIVEEWLTARQLPLECEPVFQWLRDQGLLTEPFVEQRVRLLLENGQTGFARIIARRLSPATAAPLLRWADFIEHPADEIDRYVAGESGDVEPGVLQDAWSRLARNDPGAALERYAGLADAAGVDPRGANPYALALALGLAWDRRAEAVDFFARFGPGELDDYALEWQARAGLWAGDWPLVRASIAAMSAGQRDSTRWRYWAARASEDRDERERLYAATLPDDNFYSAAAAAMLRGRAEPHPKELPEDAQRIVELAGDPAFVRSAELLAVGLPVAALREWRDGYDRLDGGDREQSIHLAAQWQWFDLAVATATQRDIYYDYGLLYPRPFADEIAAAAKATGLDTDLIYAVMRQESLYRVDAESAAGARGLMQLRPGTAAQVTARLEDSGLDHSDLLDPAVNIRLGAEELARLLERYDGQLVVALAAYNAGPRAADRWLPDAPVDADIWIENIPYNETRDYVRRVLWHRVVFRWLENGRGQDVRHWLRAVHPLPDPGA